MKTLMLLLFYIAGITVGYNLRFFIDYKKMREDEKKISILTERNMRLREEKLSCIGCYYNKQNENNKEN